MTQNGRISQQVPVACHLIASTSIQVPAIIVGGDPHHTSFVEEDVRELLSRVALCAHRAGGEEQTRLLNLDLGDIRLLLTLVLFFLAALFRQWPRMPK